MKTVFPGKLQPGDEVRIIAPARSLAIVSPQLRKIANDRLAALDLKLSFGKHVEETDDFNSTSISARVEDLHEAFRDPNVNAIITVIGGFNSNQLLRYIDWKVIADNPKIFCGYSDITILNAAILTKTGLVSYSGPHYSTFGQELDFDYTLESFKHCLMSDEPFTFSPSTTWSDDAWWRDQHDRHLLKNPGFDIINDGRASGTIIGGNLGTLNLLQGTEYMPSLRQAIVFLEDDEESRAHHFDRVLQSLIYQPDFSQVRGIVIGRFQQASKITPDLLKQIIKSKSGLEHIPVIANVDFGHTSPMATLPIGGECSIDTNTRRIAIIKH